MICHIELDIASMPLTNYPHTSGTSSCLHFYPLRNSNLYMRNKILPKKPLSFLINLYFHHSKFPLITKFLHFSSIPFIWEFASLYNISCFSFLIPFLLYYFLILFVYFFFLPFLILIFLIVFNLNAMNEKNYVF